MFKKIFIAIVIITICHPGFLLGQQKFSNKWNVYTSMKDVRGVGINGSRIWAASSGGLFSFDMNNPGSTINKYTILDGLFSNELTAGTIDNNGNVWCGGQDGSVSVYFPSTGQWKIVTDIQQSNEPNKRVYGLFQYGNSMFISNEFSLIQFSITQFQFVDQPYTHLGTLPSPTTVYQTLVINDTVWAATKNGIAYANVNSALPIQSNWRNFTTSNSVMLKNQTNSAAYFDNKIVFGTDSGMVYFQNGALTRLSPLYNGTPIVDPIYRLAVSNGSLYFTTYKYSNNFFRIDKANLTLANLVSSGIPINDLKVMENGDLIIGTANKGVDIFRNNSNTYLLPNGPNSNTFVTMEVDNNSNVWGSSGGTYEGIFRYNGSNWTNYTSDNLPPEIIGSGDFRSVYSSRYSNTVWAGGWGNGLLKFEGDSITRYSTANSCLRSLSGDYVLVFGMKEDNAGGLWMMNSFTQFPILRFREQKNCDAYQIPGYFQPRQILIKMDIDNYNTKWATFSNDEEGSPRGIMYFNESSNPTGSIVDQNHLGQNITGAYDIVVEKNGEVWIATDNGICIVRDPYQTISNPGTIPQIEKMRIIENGLSTPLLENVQCIGVDALNNKWIGTFSNGLIYVSSDGSTLIARYNTANSPLPDNKITCIKIDPKTGIAYFGTGKGMVSLQTIAVQPLENCEKIKMGPSPFIIPNASLLKIDGLVAESTVKILTISGTLVYEFKTEGGRIANWNGTDFNGNLVSSGIYIVAGYNKDATKVCTGKIAVVRK